MIFVFGFGVGFLFAVLVLGLVQMSQACVRDAELRAREFTDTSVTTTHK